MRELNTVIGGSGFIGRRLITGLISRGSDVWVPTRNSSEIYDRDLGTVFYCAGYTNDYAIDPYATVEAHVLHLLEMLQRANFDHLIYLSSTRLYDGLNVDIANGKVPLILQPSNPRHLYDISKALGENLCLAFSGSRCSVARLSCVYDFEPGSPGFLSNLLQMINAKKTIYMDSSPDFCRDYICLDDVVSGLIAMAKHRPGNIINVASGKNTYNYEISEAMSKLGVNIEFEVSSQFYVNIPECDISDFLGLGIRPINTIEYLIRFVESIYK